MAKKGKGINNSGKRSGKKDVGKEMQIQQQISMAAEHTRRAVMQSVVEEVQALEEMLLSAGGEVGKRERVLKALAAIKADVTARAWIAHFEIYQKYGLVPMAQIKAPAEPEEPKTDAEEYAEDTAGKAADEEEERQATDDLAKQRKKMIEDKKKKH